MAITIIILAALLAISAVGWIKNRIALLAIVSYIQKKGYTLPNDNDLDECSQYVVRNLFKR